MAAGYRCRTDRGDPGILHLDRTTPSSRPSRSVTIPSCRGLPVVVGGAGNAARLLRPAIRPGPAGSARRCRWRSARREQYATERRRQHHVLLGSKVPHLTYVGDATVGEHFIGASSVFVNYDGVKKQRTTIGSHVRMGSDTMYIAPVTAGDGAYRRGCRHPRRRAGRGAEQYATVELAAPGTHCSPLSSTVMPRRSRERTIWASTWGTGGIDPLQPGQPQDHHVHRAHVHHRLQHPLGAEYAEEQRALEVDRGDRVVQFAGLLDPDRLQAHPGGAGRTAQGDDRRQRHPDQHRDDHSANAMSKRSLAISTTSASVTTRSWVGELARRRIPLAMICWAVSSGPR